MKSLAARAAMSCIANIAGSTSLTIRAAVSPECLVGLTPDGRRTAYVTGPEKLDGALLVSMGRDWTSDETAVMAWARIWYSQIWVSCSCWGLFPVFENPYYGERR